MTWSHDRLVVGVGGGADAAVSAAAAHMLGHISRPEAVAHSVASSPRAANCVQAC